MMNDSVREELGTTVSSGRLVSKSQVSAAVRQDAAVSTVSTPPLPVASRKTVTANLRTNKTSPTLVDFQNKNSRMPDWRLQLQNAVQQRKGGLASTVTTTAADPDVKLVNHGNLALKTESSSEPEVELARNIPDQRVANAMRRIAESRSTFLEADTRLKRSGPLPPKAPVRPFGVVSSSNHSTATAPARPTVTPQMPKLVSSMPIASKPDTNKLPPIETPSETKPASGNLLAQRGERIKSGSLVDTHLSESKRFYISSEKADTGKLIEPEIDVDEVEDLAPFSMRFAAGLFDLIIGGFATMLVLSPLALTGGDWFSLSGFLSIVGAGALITFIYLTVCLGFFGKTVGMRLFQLELVDAIENEYPTMRQASINSALFLASLIFAGAGFATVFFNDEKRALHDLLSGTILVREF